MNLPVSNKPPLLANWLASKFIDETYLEEFFGDLYEVYEQRILAKGKAYAKLMYWFDTFHLLFGFSSLSFFKSQNTNMMLRNMFRIAWRTAIRQKQFTILNLLGLTIGIATCFLIGLYVYDEMSYDTFHVNGDRIYRINQPEIWSNWDKQLASTGPNVAIALHEDAPEFEQVTRIRNMGEQTVNAPVFGKEFNPVIEANYFAVDPNFFEVFSFEFVQGDPKTSLKEPMSMVVSEKTAVRYFGKQDPIGKTMSVKQGNGTWNAYIITGVLANIPHKSHLQFDILVSLTSFNEMLKDNDWKWVFARFSTYGLVKEGTDIASLTDKIQAIPPKWAALTTERVFKQTFAEFTQGKQWRLYLQPLRQIYLSDAPASHLFGPTGNPKFVKIFGAIGLLVLVLCIINFMNLSTARSSNRAKEVGIRKVLGSQRKTLIKQFTFESIFFVMISTLLALLLVQLSLSGFNAIAEKRLELFPHFTNSLFISALILFVLLLGGMAGSYPAFYLSSFQPIDTLKGKTSTGFKGKGIRNGLVIFQFTISITLIICTAFVQKQLSYTSSLDVGFAKDNVLQIHKIQQLRLNSEVFKTKLAANPAITRIAKSFDIPPHVVDGERYKALEPVGPVVDISNFRVDEDYLDLLGVQFLAGRNFDPDRINDKHAVVLNEEAVKILGWGTRDNYATDSPVGKFVVQAFDDEKKLEVIGVVKDFNFNSVRQKIDPLMIIHTENDWFYNYGLGSSFLSMRLNPQVVKNSKDLQSIIESVKTEMAQLDESVPFEYSFMDQEFEETFLSESRMGTVLNIFTSMALIIACLGLFGLAAFSAEQRIKELGIRKVLGAKVSQLVLTFSAEFTKLVLISILLASPIAYFLVDTWLNDFAYRTSIDIWVFLAATLGALIIAVITISYQSFMAANANPAETLKEQ